ncbi:initiator tRNA phosphoribosyl transferase [Truncatella angustata]|uniref:Initiator tRNA phosphoribosyl transferase n=1 Tax=Truncatella angustata TaxID=152316 RepID=A0A9P8ZVQ0_9PEZI|nr:initiator tRNA phosphoribosyl transferase [Truncatella angustata]KAH6652156.1 initiator tRNA phosphoribosyl transferase [Truncatella angustata]
MGTNENATSGVSQNLTLSDLVFSDQANHKFSRILTDLKKSNLSITNRLKSIKEDSAFVVEVQLAYGRPLIANERCGSWYIPPRVKHGSAYFKSTDGHTSQWKFSTRRLNLQLLDIIRQNDGCIIVDSTRRGKRMPDALGRTIPIWCCVLNRVLFPDRVSTHALHTPPNSVSESEHAQMEARIPDFVESLKNLNLDFDKLRRPKKPLRPMWITQESQLLATDVVFEDFHPVICCTSSRRVVGTELSEGGYIQGAGDDTENWAYGLTAQLFWDHEHDLMSTPEAELPALIETLVQANPAKTSGQEPRQIAPYISVAPLGQGHVSDAFTCTISLLPEVTDASSWAKSPTSMEVGLGKHKLASRNLRAALPQICDFAKSALVASQSELQGILVLCETGKDISIGVSLALLCQFFDEEGSVSNFETPKDVNKSVIKIKLSRVMTAYPEANPSRATLQSVNSFLMG